MHMPEFSPSICRQHNYVLQVSLAVAATGNRVFFIFARLHQEDEDSLDGRNVEYS